MTVQAYAITRRPLRGLHDPVREYPVAQRAVATSALIEVLVIAKQALAMVTVPEAVEATTADEALDALRRAGNLCRRVIEIEAITSEAEGPIAMGREAALEAASTCAMFTDPAQFRGLSFASGYALALVAGTRCRDAIAALEGEGGGS
ncbi:hypothetical protein [Oceanibaculum nanhaiense]|uniref:hypothetical protein n=1 Tax=Oceanibaculum nanhaiense TaxID=1909734 RepID=UPI003D2AE564